MTCRATRTCRRLIPQPPFELLGRLHTQNEICKPCRTESAVSTLYPRRSSSAFWYPSMPPSSSMHRIVLCSGKSNLMWALHMTIIDDVGGHGFSKLHTFQGNCCT